MSTWTNLPLEPTAAAHPVCGGAGRFTALWLRRGLVLRRLRLTMSVSGSRKHMNNFRQARVFTAAFFFVGVGLVAASAFLAWQTWTFMRTSKSAPGRVVDLEWRDGSAGRRGSSGGGYATVFTFMDASGQAHTVRTKSAQNPPTHQVGVPVEVLYPPTCPKDARIHSFSTLWLTPTFLLGFGVAFAGIGGYGFVVARKTYGDLLHEQTA